ncbi:ABC transporter substrate-binding protein [Bacillus atrophaeus]|uniref:ABC transporter substrate-binding protein n=1 Tax=Bacillus atrophaeus TaxID=1452 RepID=UPI002DFEDF79|nr:ABC transporter substrate-binding protein [Bacillus atrophaeus]MED4578874.1 ABC transporter substrate-binding protein [Bacillus atrophaeus]MED4719737.1 ABC transporter substrate-binding protein [Bacillus atrophaeus]
MKRLNRAARNADEPLKIEIDSLPIQLNPLITSDYTSKFISSIMYESLRHGYNCRMTHQQHQVYTVKLHPHYIGDAEKLIHTITFHLIKENQSPHLTSFLCIKNAIPFVKGLMPLEELGLKVMNKREFEVTLDEPFEAFQTVLQSSFLIPSEQNGDAVANGPYRLIHKDEKGLEFERNPEYQITPADQNTIRSIHFVFNDNLTKSIELYENNKIDVTCHTQFHHTNMDYRTYIDFKESSLPMLFTLKVKDGMLLRFIKNNLNKQQLAQDLRHIVIPTDSLLGVSSNIREKHEEIEIVSKEPVRIVYADYYPNGEIMEKVADIVKQSGIDVVIHKVSTFHEYYHLDKRIFDIELHLFLPNYLHYMSYLKYFIHDIPEKKVKMDIFEFAKHKKKEELYGLFENTTQYYPICFGKSLYLQDPCIEGFHLNPDGLLSVHDLKCR